MTAPRDYTVLSGKYLGYLERVHRDTRATAELLRRRADPERPEGIPADVWKAADRLVPINAPDRRHAKVMVSAGIIGERARCAAIALKTTHGATYYVDGRRNARLVIGNDIIADAIMAGE